MPSADRRALGRFGESAAAAYLVRHGYRLLARNWRCADGELDLIAELGAQVVFVEVRTRRAASTVAPAESVTATKQARLIRLAQAYIEAHEMPSQLAWRIDVVAVLVDSCGRVVSLEHIPHAVEG